MFEWRPIETAPKDGENVDLWFSDGFREPDCRWVKPDAAPGATAQWCSWHGAWGEWTAIGSGGKPTHWMRVSGPDA